MTFAVVLLSGGVDSATCLAIAKNMGFDVHALSFDYGQRHAIELKCAARIAQNYGITKHKVIKIDLGFCTESSSISSCALIDRDVNILTPKTTYVPARNTIFLSFALSYSEHIGAHDIFIGATAVDYSGYPDCREEYVDAFERLSNLATSSARFKIHAPLIRLNKSEIIKMGVGLGLDYSDTHSCYNPILSDVGDETFYACGKCDSCRFRALGFLQAGLPDPTIYVS